MILDKTLTYSDNQAFTTVGDVASTNILDESVDQDIGVGSRVHFAVTLGDEAAVGGGTIMATLQTDDQSDFSTAVNIAASQAKTAAQLNADGFLWKGTLPYGMKRYSRMLYTVATTDFTAGTLFAGIVFDVDMDRIYPDRLSITGRS